MSKARPVVIDASAVIELLRRTAAGKRAAAAVEGVTLAAPAHLDAEVLSALARLARDALYVALAVALNATLVTADARLARVPRKAIQIPVHVVKFESGLSPGLRAFAPATSGGHARVDPRMAAVRGP